MASPTQMDFSCPICLGIFKYPAVLSCSHSFCKACLQSWWAEKRNRECPLCKRRSSKSDPACNLALKNLCEALLHGPCQEREASAGSNALCSLHTEKLKLFCLDHQPIDETAEDYKEELKTSLKSLEEKLEHFNQVKRNWDQAAGHIHVQAVYTETQIKDEFKKLHQFLLEEEQARITALREEEEQKSRIMRRQIEALSKDIAALSDTVIVAKKELKTGSVSFLQAAVERVQHRPLLDDPRLGPGALIDMAKHLGNLAFNIWAKMKDMVSYTPVILDPNTANTNLILSKNLVSVRHTATERVRELPTNPERFEEFTTVLGSVGFNSGTRSWEVEVEDNTDWAVGVIGERVPRKGEILTGYWGIYFSDGKYRAYSPSPTDEVLSVKKPLRRVRVHLDWNGGRLSFFDPDTNTNIHSPAKNITNENHCTVRDVDSHQDDGDDRERCVSLSSTPTHPQ